MQSKPLSKILYFHASFLLYTFTVFLYMFTLNNLKQHLHAPNLY